MSATCAYENCGRPVHNNGAECIFHTAEKDPQEFRDALAEQILKWRSEKANCWNFRGWVFVDVPRKDEIGLPSYNLFCRAVFPVHVHADFAGAMFSGNASFGSATFTGTAYFRNATFSGNADFDRATFTGYANFNSVTFTGDASFGSATFTGIADFRNATFTGDAWFGSATFTRDADYKSATFTGDARFVSATFSGDADFRSATFSGIATFVSATFTGYANFNSVTFTGIARFVSTTFSGAADYDSATFTGTASFGSATFTGDANFESATFTGTAWFDSATFTGAADFKSVTFTGDARFDRATFKEAAHFASTTFLGKADFECATFQSNLDLTYASFAIVGYFSSIAIRGHVRLEWPGVGHKHKEGKELRPGRLLLKNVQFPDLQGGNPTLDLRDNALREDSPLIIKNTDMRRVLLTGTDCRRIEFYKIPLWAEWKHRSAVADEFLLRTDAGKFGNKKPNWDEIAITYQQLVVNFRKELDHPLANEFERGLFEARLQVAKTRKARGDWRNTVLLSLYKAASNFSGSVWRPLAWTLLVTVICGLFYGAILYDGQFVWPWQSDWGLMCKSAAASLRTVTLDRGLIIREIGALNGNEARLLGASLTAAFQIIVTATLITLLIFSIRRRFKHSE